MELQFNQTLCPCMMRVARETQNQEQTQEVRLPDGMPDIGRVLGAWGQVLVRSKEWRSGGMNVSGGVMVWILYAPEDGSGERSVETWIPFQMKWEFPETERDGTIRVCPLLRSVDARSISARKLMARASIGVLGEAFVPGETAVYSAGELPADVQVLRDSYPIRLPREAGEKAFTLEETLTLPASCPAIEKLVRYELQPELLDQKVMAEKVVFRGTAVLHLLYRGTDEALHGWDFELPFSQFTDLDGEYGPDGEASVALALTSLELEPGEDGSLNLKAGLLGQYMVSDRELVELVEDAYSTSRSVEVKESELLLPMMLDTRRETLRAEATVDGTATQIVDVVCLPDHPRQQRQENETELDVPAGFQVLYYDDSGRLQSGTARWDGGMTLQTDKDSRVDGWALPTGRPSAVMNGEGISLRGDILLDTLTTADQGLPMVTGLELGEEKEPDPDRPSLILMRAGGERLWDVAKRCGSTVEAIRKANRLEDEPGDRLLLIPVS